MEDKNTTEVSTGEPRCTGSALNDLLSDPSVIYKKALHIWGQESQIDMVEEECAELIVALKHLRRGRTDFLPLFDEIADVEIMIAQMRLMWGDEGIDKAKRKKLTRLAERTGLYQVPFGLPIQRVMVLCPKCGNKRCPHATDKAYKCTNSNEPGQPGSAYR